MDKALNRILIQLDIQVYEDAHKNWSAAITIGDKKKKRKWGITRQSLEHILNAESIDDVCEYLLDAIADYKRDAGSDLPTIKRARDIILSNLGGAKADELEAEFEAIEKAQF